MKGQPQEKTAQISALRCNTEFIEGFTTGESAVLADKNERPEAEPPALAVRLRPFKEEFR